MHSQVFTCGPETIECATRAKRRVGKLSSLFSADGRGKIRQSEQDTNQNGETGHTGMRTIRTQHEISKVLFKYVRSPVNIASADMRERVIGK